MKICGNYKFFSLEFLAGIKYGNSDHYAHVDYINFCTKQAKNIFDELDDSCDFFEERGEENGEL